MFNSLSITFVMLPVDVDGPSPSSLDARSLDLCAACLDKGGTERHCRVEELLGQLAKGLMDCRDIIRQSRMLTQCASANDGEAKQRKKRKGKSIG